MIWYVVIPCYILYVYGLLQFNQLYCKICFCMVFQIRKRKGREGKKKREDREEGKEREGREGRIERTRRLGKRGQGG